MIAMLKKIGRLFTIKTRIEAWLVTYAIALGAIERGRHYLETYPGLGRLDAGPGVHRRGFPGWREAARFGEAAEPALAAGPYRAPVRRRSFIGRNRPMLRQMNRASGSRSSLRTD